MLYYKLEDLFGGVDTHHRIMIEGGRLESIE